MKRNMIDFKKEEELNVYMTINNSSKFSGKKTMRDYLRIILVWFVINTVIGVLIGSIIFAYSSLPAWTVFFIALINTHIISSFTATAGYYLGNKFKNRPAFPAIFYTVIGVYPATLSGVALCALMYYLIRDIRYDSFINDHFPGLIAPTLILTAAITIVTSVIERLVSDKNKLELDIKNTEVNVKPDNKSVQSGIPVKEKENYYYVNQDNIIYLSSHGKKTIIHTEEREYVSSQLIREIEEKLDPEKFIRVHKQFIVNLAFISNVQYYSGGRYLLYLDDDDNNTIPVGRTYAQRLKSRLNI